MLHITTGKTSHAEKVWSFFIILFTPYRMRITIRLLTIWILQFFFLISFLFKKSICPASGLWCAIVIHKCANNIYSAGSPVRALKQSKSSCDNTVMAFWRDLINFLAQTLKIFRSFSLVMCFAESSEIYLILSYRDELSNHKRKRTLCF